MYNNRKQRSKTSIRILQICIISICLIITGRLYQLQILNYDTYSPLSLENSLRQQTLKPARGLIYDRHGNIIVDNEPIYTITIIPSQFDTTNIPLLASLTNFSESEIRERVESAKQYSWQRSSRLLTEVDFETFSLIQENLWRIPGIGHQIDSKRSYPADISASHILGYLREISEKQYAESDTYKLGDRAGKNGIEQVYEDFLRGQNGIEVVQVNAFGQMVGNYEDQDIGKAPVKGYDLITTLDIDLQALAEKLMKNKTGGAIALNPNDGSILAMASAPAYNLNKLSGRLDEQYWNKLNSDTSRPLYNRVTMSQQPPGSTFKPFMALTALEMGIITPKTEINNPGYYYRGRRYNDLAPAGKYNLLKALEKSSNTFFFRIMDKIGSSNQLNVWHELASDFGFGQRTGIDLSEESTGILPDSTYLNNTFGKNRWGMGDVINLGVGQGLMGVTPLQMSVVVSAIANNGYRIQPHFVDQIRTQTGKLRPTNPSKTKIEWLNKEHLDLVKQGMRRVVTDGSGRWFANLDSVKVAGKTGTAQNPHGMDHAWFIAFAPIENPEIAVAVLVENAGYGSMSAAPIASLLIEKYVTGTIKRPWLVERMLNFEPRKEDKNE